MTLSARSSRPAYPLSLRTAIDWLESQYASVKSTSSIRASVTVMEETATSILPPATIEGTKVSNFWGGRKLSSRPISSHMALSRSYSKPTGCSPSIQINGG